MIEFDCPHCGNPFKVRDKHAGRDGWCRVCKRLVVVPEHDGSGIPWDEMSAHEKMERLDKKLQYAASQADYYKILIAKFCEKLHKVITGEVVRYHQVDDELLMSYLSKTKSALAELRASDGVDADEAFDSPSDENDDLLERADQATCLHEAELRIEELETQLDANRTAILEAEERIGRLKDNLESKEERLAALSESAEESSEAAQAEAGLVEALRSEVDSLLQSRDEAVAQRGTLSDELNSMVAEVDASVRAREDAEELADQRSKQIDTLRAELESILEASPAEIGLARELSGAEEQPSHKDGDEGDIEKRDRALEEERAKTRAHLARLEELQRELAAASDLRIGLEGELSEAEMAIKDVSSKFSEALSHGESTEATAAELQKELASMREDYTLSVRLRDETHVELEDRNAEISSLRTQLATQKKAFKNKASVEKRSSKKTTDELTKSKASLQERLGALEKKFGAIEREGEEARKALAEAHVIKTRLDEELAKESAALVNLTESTSTEKEALRFKLAEAKATVERLEMESQEAAEQVETRESASLRGEDEAEPDAEGIGILELSEPISESDSAPSLTGETDDEGNPMVASYLRFLNSK